MIKNPFSGNMGHEGPKLETIGMTPEVKKFINRVYGFPEGGSSGEWSEYMTKLAKRVAALEPGRFKQIHELSRRLSEPVHALDFLKSDALGYFFSDNPSVRRAAELIVEKGGRIGISVLQDHAAANEIFTQPDPAAYVEEKFGLVERINQLGEVPNVNLNLMSLDEGKVSLVEGLPDTGHRDLYAAYLSDPKIDKQELAARIDFWERIMTPDMWSFVRVLDGEGLRDLIQEARTSWMLALEKRGGIEGLRDLLRDEKAVESFLLGNGAARLGEKSQDRENDYVRLKQREILPIGGVDEDSITEVRSIMAASGLEDVIRNIVSSIVLAKKTDIGSASGNWNEPSLTMRLAFDVKEGYFKAGIMFHELGHAGQTRLANVPGAQEAFDRYCVELLYEGVKASSSYSEAFALLNRRENIVFIRESFAEDFRILLEYPDSLPENRLKSITDLFRLLAPGLKLEQIQKKVRLMYGNFYGVNVKDVQRPADCESAAKMAEIIGRMHKEG